MANLVLGPLLRYVGERDATIWVETDAPCTVEVRAGEAIGTETTFAVAGHHYALVVVEGLAPGSSTPYEVRLDADPNPVWPTAERAMPPSRIRTVDVRREVRLVFGSCHEALEAEDRSQPDVLNAYAIRMASQAHEEWPDLFLMVGDQVYADETSEPVRDWIRSRRDVSQPPGLEVADFEEYTRLYRESWRTPHVRWLLSTLPTAMMFDDHDVRDDWNTSDAWRRDMQATEWWGERITGALMSYWIYQHLGNLSPAALKANETYQAVRTRPDGELVLRAFAQNADREADGAKGTMWSYRRDLGGVRLIVIDSRCGRILADGRRSMISDREFRWIEQQAEDGSYDHLVVGTSVPWLLPRALHDLESWDEALSAGAGGPILARFGEWLRRAVDLEHWAAFRASFDRLAQLFERVGRGSGGVPPPATISVVSGDVHHSYVSEAEYPEAMASRVYQITCSPLNNTIPRLMRGVFRIGWNHAVERITRRLAARAGVPPLPIRWHHPTGPHFGNSLATLVFKGRDAGVMLERSVEEPLPVPGEKRKAPQPGLAIVVELALTGAPRS